MQELSAKTNYPFHGVMMLGEHDHTIWGKKHKNNIRDYFYHRKRGFTIQWSSSSIYFKGLLNYFIRWKQMGWWSVGGRNLQTPQLQYTDSNSGQSQTLAMHKPSGGNLHIHTESWSEERVGWSNQKRWDWSTGDNRNIPHLTS